MPFTFSFDVCNTIWGQRVTATYERTYDGKWCWTLKKHASSQRDEDTSIGGLPDGAIPQFVLGARDAAKRRWFDDEYHRKTFGTTK